MHDNAVESAIAAAQAATTPEMVVHDAMKILYGALGDRTAHLKTGALESGQRQFFVAGGFFVTPGRRHQMLVGNTGFPPEQRRLLIPIDGGHPGRVIAAQTPILLVDTRKDTDFRQYLKTSRMGSAIYAPLIWSEEAHGLIIVAAQAGGTFDEADLSALIRVASVVAPVWRDRGGPEWLAAEYRTVSGAAVSNP